MMVRKRKSDACKCGCVRFMNIHMKHNDLAGMSIPHLKLEVHDYLPYVGDLGGDSTDMEICMECGQIKGWTAISDADILNNEAFQEHLAEKAEEEAAELEHRAAMKRLNAQDKSPNVITLSHVRKAGHERIQITPNSAIIKVRPFDACKIDPTHNLLMHYKETIKWWTDQYNFGGRFVESPRRIGLMGDKDYEYSNIKHIAQPWDEETKLVQRLCYEKIREELPWFESDPEFLHNGVLFNHYRNGLDSISTHSDKEDGIDLSVPIMSVNLGAERTFCVHDGKTTTNVPLRNGDVILMIGNFQQELKHSVPKEVGKGERINLTFRRFL